MVRLLIQVRASNPFIVFHLIFIPSVIISAVSFVFIINVLHVAEVAGIVDPSHSAAAMADIIIGIRCVLSSLVARSTAYNMDNLVEWIVASFLSNTGCACRAH